jgi:uncharacterized protein YndB with AHSA1/START domain
VRNEIDVEAPPERVWGWLVLASRWPEWYPNASRVAIAGLARGLGPGVRFRWRTFGVSLQSRVAEFVPFERLAWSAEGLGVDVYHAWLIVPRPFGAHVLTEESQYGGLARLGHALRPRRMWQGHETWLVNLRARSIAGAVPP